MTFGNEMAGLYRRDIERVRQELAAFDNEPALWRIAPGIANPAGNLALHLEGNLREYIGRQLGGVAYVRQRPREFAARGVPMADLLSGMESVKDTIPRIVSSLSGAEWDADYPENVLGVPLSTRQFLIHLHGHLNYHLGQIDYLRRVLTGQGAITLVGL